MRSFAAVYRRQADCCEVVEVLSETLCSYFSECCRAATARGREQQTRCLGLVSAPVGHQSNVESHLDAGDDARSWADRHKLSWPRLRNEALFGQRLHTALLRRRHCRDRRARLHAVPQSHLAIDPVGIVPMRNLIENRNRSDPDQEQHGIWPGHHEHLLIFRVVFPRCSDQMRQIRLPKHDCLAAAMQRFACQSLLLLRRAQSCAGQ
jgi:hypothetical protein